MGSFLGMTPLGVEKSSVRLCGLQGRSEFSDTSTSKSHAAMSTRE